MTLGMECHGGASMTLWAKCRELNQDGRKRIVEMLWEVVMADGVVHEFESNLVWRTAELLCVSTRDRVMLRKAVEARVSMR
jgi:uncharacterized tellurite resistance protein B-like protein